MAQEIEEARTKAKQAEQEAEQAQKLAQKQAQKQAQRSQELADQVKRELEAKDAEIARLQRELKVQGTKPIRRGN